MVDKNSNFPQRRELDVRFPSGHNCEMTAGIRQVPDVHQVVKTLDKLHWAKRCAIDSNCDIWEFAIEMSDFLGCGISRQDLRQMVSRGWIEHRREITLPNLEQREFQEEALYTFSQQSCFAITPKGQQQFGNYLNSTDIHGLNLYVGHEAFQPGIEKPIWDHNLRELRFGETIVKRFKWPAAIQFAVLERFEQMGWPSRIPSPLPTEAGICPKRRLHDAIKCLNQRKENDLIRFRGDGTGDGVVVQISSAGDRTVSVWDVA